jgi:chromosome segregation ATPase
MERFYIEGGDMREAKVLLMIAFILFALAICAGFYLHELALERMLMVEQKQQGTAEKMDTFDKKLNDYQNVLDNFDSQFKKYAENLRNLETAVGPSDAGRKDLVVSVNAMKKDIEDLRTNYTSTISQLQDKIRDLEGALATKQAVNQKVQLGEVAVEKKK